MSNFFDKSDLERKDAENIVSDTLKNLYRNLYLGIFFQTNKKASAPSKTFSSFFTCNLIKDNY